MVSISLLLAFQDRLGHRDGVRELTVLDFVLRHGERTLVVLDHAGQEQLAGLNALGVRQARPYRPATSPSMPPIYRPYRRPCRGIIEPLGMGVVVAEPLSRSRPCMPP